MMLYLTYYTTFTLSHAEENANLIKHNGGVYEGVEILGAMEFMEIPEDAQMLFV